MIACIINRGSLRGIGRRIADIPLSELDWPTWVDPPQSGFVGDLAAEDCIVLPSSSRTHLASRRNLRCRTALWMREPPAVQPRYYRWIGRLSRRFDHILTYDQATLSRIDNGLFVAHGGCWVDDPQSAGRTPKTRDVSIVASPKRDLAGHRLRHQIIAATHDRGKPVEAFGRQYQTLRDKRDAHDAFRFSVVVENSRSSHYFTEKLIDSLVCLCLPIYWGTPDIDDYFDTDGMIVCHSPQDILAAIDAATPAFYQSRLSALQANRDRALRYVDQQHLVFRSLMGDRRDDESTVWLGRFDRSRWTAAAGRPNVSDPPSPAQSLPAQSLPARSLPAFESAESHR